MISVNWHKFQAKVGDSAPAEFERLCYLIFCRIYNKQYGIMFGKTKQLLLIFCRMKDTIEKVSNRANGSTSLD